MIDWICAKLDHPIVVPNSRRRYVRLRCQCGAYDRLVDQTAPLTEYVTGWGPGKYLRVRIVPK